MLGLLGRTRRRGDAMVFAEVLGMTPQDAAEAFMDTTYGRGWKASLFGMLQEAGVRLSRGVYPTGTRSAEDLTVLYDELYCAVTNVVPHKPPLVGAQGWRADDVVA